MKFSDLKREALIKLQGNWTKAILINMINIAITFILSLITNTMADINQIAKIIAQIIVVILALPISYGYIVSMIKISRSEEVQYFDFLLFGFKNFAKVWKLFIVALIKLIPSTLLVAILTVTSNICLYFSNSLAQTFGIVLLICSIAAIIYYISKIIGLSFITYILNDNEDSSAKEVANKSEELLKGKRIDLILFYLSFILWFLLIIGVDYVLLSYIPYGNIFAVILSIISYLIIDTYITFSVINFYEDLRDNA